MPMVVVRASTVDEMMSFSSALRNFEVSGRLRLETQQIAPIPMVRHPSTMKILLGG